MTNSHVEKKQQSIIRPRPATLLGVLVAIAINFAILQPTLLLQTDSAQDHHADCGRSKQKERRNRQRMWHASLPIQTPRWQP